MEEQCEQQSITRPKESIQLKDCSAGIPTETRAKDIVIAKINHADLATASPRGRDTATAFRNGATAHSLDGGDDSVFNCENLVITILIVTLVSLLTTAFIAILARWTTRRS